ncbi:MAG: Gldg family protein [Gammaproteobacteria bacterium]|nr:Gldg family protein [Gammaproteobacteria bacterium]
MRGQSPKTLGAGMLVVLAVVLVAAVVTSQQLLTGARLDLTENRLYTLSPGTRTLLARIDEPINLYFFFSERATRDFPALRTYSQRVRELLEEMSAASGGRLRLQVLDPAPFSEAEDRATAFGLQGFSIGPLGESVYFGLAGSNAVGEQALIEFFDPQQEAFLEYELARLVLGLLDAQRPVVGLLSGLQVEGGFDPLSRQMGSPWVVVEQARQLFELRSLAPGLTQIDEDIDILWLLHPRDLAEPALYAIDQFLLRGGRVLALVDPFAQLDQPDPMDPTGGMEHVPASSLNRLLSAWGVQVPEEEIVLDDVNALTVSGMAQRPVRHLGLIGIRRDGLNNAAVTTAALEQINFAFSGHIVREADSPLALEVLVSSSEQAAVVPAFAARMNPDPESLREDFVPEGRRLTLAARLSGSVPTNFPDGPPAPANGAAADDDGDAEAPVRDHLTHSRGDINLLLIADSDVASDRMWVQVQSFFGQRLPSAFASNGDFLINALDYLGGSEELMGLRGRAPFQRPFTRVETLRREADARVSETLARLEAELGETEQRLAELQSAREDAGSLLLSPEQEAEIERFRQRQVQLRQELRQVQRDREASIEALGTRLKILNIALVPVLLTLAVLVGAWRRRRREAGA